MASHTAVLLEFWQEQACKHWKALRQNAPVNNDMLLELYNLNKTLITEFWQEQACKHCEALRQNAPVYNDIVLELYTGP